MNRQYFYFLVFLLLTIPLTAKADSVADPDLQGTWRVIAGEHGGQPMDAMNGGTMTIKGDRFRIDTSSGNVLEGQLILNRTVSPATMVMLHDNEVEWHAIYEVKTDDFRLNYIDAKGPDPMPETFRTTPDTEATVVILKRHSS
ncbi:MAG: TIGR03067 domain-containing protein [Pseudomonadota bacterium]